MRKAIPLWLVCLMFVVIAAGCSTGSDSKGGESSSSQPTPTSTSTSQETAVTNAKLVDKDTEITVLLGESNLVPLSDDMLHYKWMYEQTGIKVKFMPIPVSDYNSKKNTMLSTNDFPDIIQVSTTDVNKFADTGIFVDLSKYKDQLPNFFDKVEKYPDAKFTFVDGNPYAFPTLNRWDLTRGSGLIVRDDVMKELGISSPKTFEEFYAMLKQFKEKYPDSIPFINRNGSKNLMNTLGYSLGSGWTIMFDPQADKFLFQPAKPETKEVLAYLNKLYKEKLLDPDYISTTGTQWEEKMSSGKGLSYLDNVGFAERHLGELQAIDSDAKWEVQFLPTNSIGYARGLYTSPQNVSRMWAISSRSKNIDVAIKMFNWLYSEEAADLMNLGKEGEDFIRQADGSVEMTPETLKKYTNDKGEFEKEAMHKERGNAAYETFIPYSDLHSYFASTSPDQLRWYQEVQQKDKAYAFPVLKPPFNADESAKVSTIQAKLETIAGEMFDKIIIGHEPVDAFDNYVEKFKSNGLDELEKIYNDAYQRVK